MLDLRKTEVRASAILTNSYVAATVFPAADKPFQSDQLELLLDFTIGSLTSCDVKVEKSFDGGASWYVVPNITISAGTSTLYPTEYSLTTTGKFVIALPVAGGQFRVSAKGNGTVTSSLLTITAILSNQN